MLWFPWKQRKRTLQQQQMSFRFKEKIKAQTGSEEGGAERSSPPPPPSGSSQVCCVCLQRVFVLERLSAEGRFFHRCCFRCRRCLRPLRLGASSYDRSTRQCSSCSSCSSSEGSGLQAVLLSSGTFSCPQRCDGVPVRRRLTVSDGAASPPSSVVREPPPHLHHTSTTPPPCLHHTTSSPPHRCLRRLLAGVPAVLLLWGLSAPHPAAELLR